MSKKYVVIGGVATGASAAARLRRLNEEAEIIVLEKGNYVSFSNCGLPYRFSNTIDQTEKLVLMTPEKLKAQYNLNVRTNNEVLSINDSENYVVVKNHLTGEEYHESYDELVIAPGTSAIVPPFAGLDLLKHFVLKTVTDVERIMNVIEENTVKHVSVIGGGFIGVETAENFREAGYEVTLIEGADQILAPFDYEMANHADLELHKHGVELIKGDLVDHFKENTIVLKSNKEIKTDLIIMAIGVKPETSFVASSNVKLTDRGFIEVDDNYQTNIANIHAGGDAILITNQLTKVKQPLALAGPANKQGRLIADHISGKNVLNKGYIGSSIIKVFDLTLAATGLNEKVLKTTDIDYEVVYAAPSDRVGIMPNVSLVLSKLIFEKESGKILGAQAVSTGVADKRIDVIATAIKAEMNIYDLTDLELTYAPSYGTGKDVVNKLGYIATNLNDGLYKQVSFTDVYNLVKSQAQIIDVREVNEYARGHIKGVKNIPMSEFRNRLDEFDKTKPVYVHCQTGQRSYNVVCALNSYGFEAYNVAGSYLFTLKHEQAMQLSDSTRENILV